MNTLYIRKSSCMDEVEHVHICYKCSSHYVFHPCESHCTPKKDSVSIRHEFENGQEGRNYFVLQFSSLCFKSSYSEPLTILMDPNYKEESLKSIFSFCLQKKKTFLVCWHYKNFWLMLFWSNPKCLPSHWLLFQDLGREWKHLTSFPILFSSLKLSHFCPYVFRLAKRD